VTLEEAADVFCRGFTFTRSLTYPYLFLRDGPLRVMRDAPRGSQRYRTSEVVLVAGALKEGLAAVQAGSWGRFALCYIVPPTRVAEARDEVKRAGFRLARIEALMVRDLTAPIPPADPRVQRVDSIDAGEQVSRVARSRQISVEHLVPNSPLRLYRADAGGSPVGWVRSIDGGEGARWVSNLFVQPEYRRKGLATALMNRMLADDAALGYAWSVLLATHAGAALYPSLGYEQIGTLLLFRPSRHLEDGV
jgi:GNAT superfamily N-acetyltransferase